MSDSLWKQFRNSLNFGMFQRSLLYQISCNVNNRLVATILSSAIFMESFEP